MNYERYVQMARKLGERFIDGKPTWISPEAKKSPFYVRWFPIHEVSATIPILQDETIRRGLQNPEIELDGNLQLSFNLLSQTINSFEQLLRDNGSADDVFQAKFIARGHEPLPVQSIAKQSATLNEATHLDSYIVTMNNGDEFISDGTSMLLRENIPETKNIITPTIIDLGKLNNGLYQTLAQAKTVAVSHS